MRVLLQRVKRASVRAGAQSSAIGPGLLVFLGVEKADDFRVAETLAKKVLDFRVFEDEAGKMNRSVLDTSGEVLVVSQFTLCADNRKGNRPSFDPAAPPEQARNIYHQFVQYIEKKGIRVETGFFGETMEVEIINSGPATFLLENN